MKKENMFGNSKPENDLANAMETIILLSECIVQVSQSVRAIANFLKRFYKGGMEYDLPPAILETLLDCKAELVDTASELGTQIKAISNVYGGVQRWK